MKIHFIHPQPRITAQKYPMKDVAEALVDITKVLSMVVRMKRGYVGVYSVDTKIFQKFGLTPRRGVKWQQYTKVLHGEVGNYPRTYVLTSLNSPEYRWAMKSLSNYLWLWNLAQYLCSLYAEHYRENSPVRDYLSWCSPNQWHRETATYRKLTPQEFPHNFLTIPPK